MVPGLMYVCFGWVTIRFDVDRRKRRRTFFFIFFMCAFMHVCVHVLFESLLIILDDCTCSLLSVILYIYICMCVCVQNNYWV
ncbi:hypothetical protein PO909_012972 [Leuciscus waleckii]